MPKMRWQPGIRPEPRWGADHAPPDPLVVEYPYPSAPSAPRFSRLQRSASVPQCKILTTPLMAPKTKSPRPAASTCGHGVFFI